MQGKYKTKKCSSGIKKIKKYAEGTNGIDEESLAKVGSVAGLVGGLIPAVTSEGQGAKIGSVVGSTVGQAANLLVPGLGTLASPILGGVGSMIGGVLGNDEAKARAERKKLAYQSKLAKNNANITTDLTSFQAKQYSNGSSKLKTKVIEIEGKQTPEIHTDANFNVKNLGTTPHSKGGNKVLAEEGDVVFPTQNSPKKYNEIMNAIMKKDKYKLKKEQNKLPEDKASKYDRGTKKVKDPLTMSAEEYRRIQPKKTSGINKFKFTPPEMKLDQPFAFSTGVFKKPIINKKEVTSASIVTPKRTTGVSNKKAASTSTYKPELPKIGDSRNADLSGLPTNNLSKEQIAGREAESTYKFPESKAGEPSVDTDSKKKKPRLGVNNALELAPIAYNLGQGLFGKTEKVNRRTINPELESYVDTSAGTRKAINEGYKTSLSNSRNLSGGLASNIRANSQAASNARVGQVNQVDSQEYGKQLDVNNRNIQTKNNAALTNLGLQNQYDELDAQNRAKKQEALSTGLTDLGALASRNILQKNQLQAQKDNITALSYGRGYTFEGDENGQNLEGTFKGSTGIPTLGNNLLGDSTVKRKVKRMEKGIKSLSVERKYKKK